jgi:hypothetical protein
MGKQYSYANKVGEVYKFSNFCHAQNFYIWNTQFFSEVDKIVYKKVDRCWKSSLQGWNPKSLSI